jgi:hypothetical protein
MTYTELVTGVFIIEFIGDILRTLLWKPWRKRQQLKLAQVQDVKVALCR